MKDLIYSLALFTNILYFCVSAILGRSMGSDTLMYQFVCVLSFAFSITLFVVEYIKMKMTWNDMFILFGVVVIFLIGYVGGYVRSTMFLCFTAFCIPAACIGIRYSRKGNLAGIIKWLDILMLIITFSLLFFVRTVSSYYEAGDYSQRYSYLAAFAFNLNLFLSFYGNKYERFEIFKSKAYRFFCYALLPVYPVVIFLSGGRGGFVTMALGLVLFILTLEGKKSKRRKIWWYVIGAAVAVVAILPFLRSSSIGSLFTRNIGRVFSYVTDSGLDLSQTAGRNKLYALCWQLFTESPLTGYGLFGYGDILGSFPYAHNLFLEWLLQGGILFFFFWLTLLIVACYKGWKLFKTDIRFIMLLPIAAYPLSQLMFSSSYLEEPLFWFFMAFTLTANVSRISSNAKKEKDG